MDPTGLKSGRVWTPMVRAEIDASVAMTVNKRAAAVFNDVGIDALSVSALTCARTAFSPDDERKVIN